MSEHELIREPVLKAAVEVRVEPAKVTKLAVGSRWEVVNSSLSSLGYGPHPVTLRQVENGAAPGVPDDRA